MRRNRRKPFRVERISPAAAAAFFGQAIDFPIIAWGGYRGRRLVGVGGLAWRFGRCEVWLDLKARRYVSPLGLVRAAHGVLKVARQMGDDVVVCFRDDLPNSAEFLSLLGMRQVDRERLTHTDGRTEERELWATWQASPH